MIRRKMHLVFKRSVSALRNDGDCINIACNGESSPSNFSFPLFERFEKSTQWEYLTRDDKFEVNRHYDS